ncbi:MAG: DUF1730 domain-containing protein [Gammaproteobacteria bacterium]|nr:MAG: DUF1730 domain-containing protein [Gammaproteobacteria bacterium]
MTETVIGVCFPVIEGSIGSQQAIAVVGWPEDYHKQVRNILHVLFQMITKRANIGIVQHFHVLDGCRWF